MKKIIAFTLLLLSGISHAENLTISYDQVPVTQLLVETYRNKLEKSYVIDPSVVSNNSIVSINVRDLPIENLEATVDGILKTAGINKVVGSDGLILFTARAYDYSPDLPPAPVSFFSPGRGVSEADGASVVSLQNGSIPDNFTVFLAHNRPTSFLQPIANTLLGTNYDPSDQVFLSGPVASVEKVRFILEQLDTAPNEIMAQAVVLEFSTESTEGSGFELAISALSGKLNIGLTSLLPTAGSFVKWSSTDLTAVLSAVSGDSRFHVVSTPTLRVVSGATGKITVGQEVPTLSSSSLDNSGNAVQSIEYRSAGVIMELKPTILRNKIDLELRQQISDFSQNSLSGIDSPTLTKRELLTKISAQPGELIVLGGLDQKKDADRERRLSFLPSFLGGKSSTKSNTQILLVLQLTKI